MSALRNYLNKIKPNFQKEGMQLTSLLEVRLYLNKIKPNFQKGGKLHAFESVFDGFESFLYLPNTTAKSCVPHS